jgi:hypothetical protein
MFKFLKKLFSEPEEEVEKQGIKLEELDIWFKEKSDKIFTNLNIEIKDMKNNVKDEIIKAKDNLAILSTAKLHNPKITVKEKQFMEGNRKSYILLVNNFLRGIDLEEDDYSALLKFCNDFNPRLERFGKSTVRPYHILQEFFSHESRNIAINIKNLDGSIKELGNIIKNANLNKINEIKIGIVNLNNKIKQKDELDVILKDKEKIKQSLLKNKQDTEKEIERLVKSKEYEQLNELKTDKETLLASIREHNAKIVHAFSVMERPLRKLTRMVVEDADLLKKYIDNPVEALVNDHALKISKLLKKLENNINNYTLDLKDKKREKVLETVKGLTDEFLREFINKHKELSDKLENLEKEINENQALKKQNKLNYESSNLNDNLEKANTEILSNQQELSKINIQEMKNNLGKEINELLKTDVVIS